jgi:hypothetical protein
MAIDQRDVSSKLRFMDDRALQQYAAMHKSDPYIFPLAFQESQNRQKLRMSQQAQTGAQPQPKVADQALAQMAPPQAQPMPETQGIGALAAPNMQGMADGGIAGYDDANFAERSEPVVMMAEGGVARYDFGGVTYADWAQGEARRRRALLDAERERNMREVAAGQTYVPSDNPAAAFSDPRLLGPTPAEETVGYIPPKPAPVTKADTGQKDVTASKTDTSRKTGPSASASAKLPTTSDLTALRQQILDKQDYSDPAASGLLELESRERANAAADKSAIERDAEKFKDAYKGREGRLAEREADIGKQKDQNTGLALLNAGLAIMSTPGGLATAIGKGAQVGTAQFAAGLDKIRSAQERLGEARDKLDDMKLNRDENTAKEIRAAERNYRDVAVNAQKRTIDGIRMAADVNEKRASDIYSKTVDMTKTIYEQGEANKRVTAAENAKLNFYRALGSAPEGSALQKGFQLSKQEGSEPKMYADYVKMSSDPLTSDAFLKKYPTFEVYKAGMGGGMQFVAPPANAPVLSKPKS